MSRYPYIDSSLPKNEYERNIAWIDFENKYKGRTPNRLKKWTVKLCAHFLPRHIAVGLVSGLVKQGASDGFETHEAKYKILPFEKGKIIDFSERNGRDVVMEKS